MSVKFLITKTYWYFRRWGLRALLRRILVELRLRLRHDKGRSAADVRFPDLVNLAGVAPLGGSGPNGRIAVHAHIFYLDLAEEMAAHLRHIPFAFDLLVSTADEPARIACEAVFRSLHRVERLCVRVTPNRRSC